GDSSSGYEVYFEIAGGTPNGTLGLYTLFAVDGRQGQQGRVVFHQGLTEGTIGQANSSAVCFSSDGTFLGRASANFYIDVSAPAVDSFGLNPDADGLASFRGDRSITWFLARSRTSLGELLDNNSDGILNRPFDPGNPWFTLYDSVGWAYGEDFCYSAADLS